ncbi:hypothetical protein [uncultured Pontibacter sp.]|uniref:hypothetical protein n=1 Tax=uncultured Pontibacter sp. TaxID=453356 RepID=UPI00262E30E0|nr:hypothetical protein [uncultured Pontibacter sp.]
MKKKLILYLLSAGMGLGVMLQQPVAASVLQTVASAANTHPTEAKYDKIMQKYANGLKAAFAEKDDKKTVTMVHKLNDEMVTALQGIKPELERWIKGMTEKDKEAFEQRAETKPYLKTILEIMFNPEIGKRIENNPELKAALESSDKRMKEMGFESDDADEEDID